MASALLVGLDMGSTTGRSTWAAIARMASSVKAPAVPEVPMSTVGLKAFTTESRSRFWPRPSPMRSASAAGQANSR